MSVQLATVDVRYSASTMKAPFLVVVEMVLDCSMTVKHALVSQSHNVMSVTCNYCVPLLYTQKSGILPSETRTPKTVHIVYLQQWIHCT